MAAARLSDCCRLHCRRLSSLDAAALASGRKAGVLDLAVARIRIRDNDRADVHALDIIRVVDVDAFNIIRDCREHVGSGRNRELGHKEVFIFFVFKDRTQR
jgi:hypothetical protein